MYEMYMIKCVLDTLPACLNNDVYKYVSYYPL